MAHVLDDLFQDRPTHLLFFVVIACPLTMNLLQVVNTVILSSITLCLQACLDCFVHLIHIGHV